MGPSNRWVLWLRWVTVMVVAGVVIPLVIGATREILWLQLLVMGLLAAILVTYQPIRQYVEGSCGGTSVAFTLSMDMLGRLFLHVGGSPERIRLGAYRGVPLWLKPAIEVAGRSEQLLIYFRFPSGFLVSQAAGNPTLTVTRNEFRL